MTKPAGKTSVRAIARFINTLSMPHKQMPFGNGLMADSDVHGLAAENSDGLMVGFTHYLFHATTGDVRNKCYLQELYVDTELRVSGAGRALIEAVYKKGDEANVSEVYWMTQKFNSVACVLYDRVGQQTPFIKYRRPV